MSRCIQCATDFSTLTTRPRRQFLRVALLAVCIRSFYVMHIPISIQWRTVTAQCATTLRGACSLLVYRMLLLYRAYAVVSYPEGRILN